MPTHAHAHTHTCHRAGDSGRKAVRSRVLGVLRDPPTSPPGLGVHLRAQPLSRCSEPPSSSASPAAPCPLLLFCRGARLEGLAALGSPGVTRTVKDTVVGAQADSAEPGAEHRGGTSWLRAAPFLFRFLQLLAGQPGKRHPVFPNTSS